MKKRKRPVVPALFIFALILLITIGCQDDDSDTNKPLVVESGTVNDIHGNTYATVKLDQLWWMARNLDVSLYNDGTPIKQGDPQEWFGLQTGAWCWYNNDSAQGEIYGRLYNFFAVETQKLCPEGWRVPSDEDWHELEIFLGMDPFDLHEWQARGGARNIGGKLKSESTSLWKSPNKGASNESLFNALPGGSFQSHNNFTGMGEFANFWSSTPSDNGIIYRYLHYNDQNIFRFHHPQQLGFSVRCVKNAQ